MLTKYKIAVESWVVFSLCKNPENFYWLLYIGKYVGLLSKILEKEMATHSIILAWEIPRIEAGELQSMRSQKSQIQLKWLRTI